jgi:hypothetical protein
LSRHGRRGVIPESTRAASFNAVTFIVFGAAIPAPPDDLGCVLVYAVLSLTVAGMVPVAPALLGTGARRQTIAFVGWFGPRGLATIVFAVIMIDESSLPHERPAARRRGDDRHPVLAHGLTAGR